LLSEAGSQALLLHHSWLKLAGIPLYWMPDVFERYFAHFGKTAAQYYSLQRLDPAYRVYGTDGPMDIPAGFEQIKEIFESVEPGSSKKLDKFIKEAAYKYKLGMQQLVYKPGQSYPEFLEWKIIKGIFKLDVFTSMEKHIHNHFQHRV
jgi:phytoene desaturase